MFNRRSTLALSGSFGEVRLGRDYTPQFWNYGLFDPFNGVGVGAAQHYLSYAATTNANIRASNSIGYFLPRNLGGIYGQVMYHLGENAQGTATENDGRGHGIRLGYATGPLDVAVSYAQQEFAAGDLDNTSVGASYKFGIAKLMGMYARDTRNAAAGRTTLNGWVIGAVVPVGVGQVQLAYSQNKTDAPTGTDPVARKIALGYGHNLSKRTAVYATVAQVRNSDGSAVALGGATTATNRKSSGIDLGIRHSF